MSAGREGLPVATGQELEAYRDRTLRRTPARRVRGERSALAFVDAVGFCFTLSDFGLPVASLYVAVCGRRHPRRPKHTHHDPDIGLTWRLKDTLPARRLVYYGKLVKGKPTLVSLDLLPAFCRLVREDKGSGDYLVDYRQGRMTRSALAILDALHDRGPLITPELRRAVHLQAAQFTAEFDRAMAELQRGLWIVKVEEIYDPDFYYRWDLLDNWLPAPIRQGFSLSREAAAGRLLAAYLAAAAASQPRFLGSLLGLPPREVEASLAALEAAGTIQRGRRIRGLPGEWVVWTGEPCG
jgi:hypothetical protein